MPLSLKKQSQTRWYERFEAVVPVAKHYPGVLKALERVLSELKSSLEPKAYNKVIGLKKYFSSFQGLCMTVFWFKVLGCINERSVIIQSQEISLDIQVKLINDLHEDMQRLRDSWTEIINESRLVVQTKKIPSSFPNPNKRSRPSPSSETLVNTEEENFKTNIVYRALDFILYDLKTRFEATNSLTELFSPILKFNSLEESDLKCKATKLVSTYKNDLSVNFCDEILHLKHISNTVFQVLPNSQNNPLQLLNSIYEKQLEPVFMNVCIALRIFCTIPVTVASAERAFSKLGNVLKTWQRSSMSQERLNSLAVLAIEHRLASSIDFRDVIDTFSMMKARKM